MSLIARRGFLAGFGALVAAPAVIRIAPLMPISTRFVPLYVPVVWLSGERFLVDLKNHAWPRPLEDSWINLND